MINKRILDIAIEYGFETQESFTRSFKQKMGVTPGKYRKDGRHYALYLPAVLSASDLVTMTGGNPMKNVMEATILTKPEFKVIGLQLDQLEIAASSNAAENGDSIPKLWDEFNRRVCEIANRKDLSTSYGICIPTGGMKFTYMCAVEVSSFDHVPEGMVTYTVPEQQYAIFTHKGPAATIPDTTNKVFGEWLPQTGYEFALAPELEVYGKRFIGPLCEDSETEIYVPIK